jgi:hypothetical protein
MQQGSLLLSIAPLSELTDEGMSARSHVLYIENTLNRYGKSIRAKVFFGDNCSTNQKIARDTRKPLMGCYSHRWNLAMQTLYKTINKTRREKDDELLTSARISKHLIN